MDSKLIDKLIEQHELIEAMQENEDNCLKMMKMYEECRKRINKAIEYIEKNINENEAKFYGILDYKVFKGNIEQVLEILKGEDKE